MANKRVTLKSASSKQLQILGKSEGLDEYPQFEAFIYGDDKSQEAKERVRAFLAKKFSHIDLDPDNYLRGIRHPLYAGPAGRSDHAIRPWPQE